MTLKQLLAIMFSATVICWLTWLMVLFQIDPTDTSILGFLIFYLSLFFALVGTIFLMTFAWRKLFNHMDLEYKIVGSSFRQSISFAALIVAILFLQSHNLLTWWNIIIIIASLTLLEFFFLSFRKKI